MSQCRGPTGPDPVHGPLFIWTWTLHGGPVQVQLTTRTRPEGFGPGPDPVHQVLARTLDSVGTPVKTFEGAEIEIADNFSVVTISEDSTVTLRCVAMDAVIYGWRDGHSLHLT